MDEDGKAALPLLELLVLVQVLKVFTPEKPAFLAITRLVKI